MDNHAAAGLSLQRDGTVAIVTLNRPHRLNALSRPLCAALVATAEALSNDATVRAVVLTGAGAGFCAGADLIDGGFAPRAGETRGAATRRFLEEDFNPVALAWYRLAKPVVVAVNGIAAGGGVGLALTGDFVLAADSASFVQVFTPKLALVPDMGCSWQLPRLVGQARAKALALLGDRLDATTAAQWGLIHAAVPAKELAANALTLAQRLAAGPATAQSAVKALFNDADSFAAALAEEARLQEALGNHPDHAEGLAAFVGKRSPRYS